MLTKLVYVHDTDDISNELSNYNALIDQMNAGEKPYTIAYYTCKNGSMRVIDDTFFCFSNPDGKVEEIQFIHDGPINKIKVLNVNHRSVQNNNTIKTQLRGLVKAMGSLFMNTPKKDIKIINYKDITVHRAKLHVIESRRLETMNEGESHG